MEQYQLLPLVVAVIALLGGLAAGLKLVQFPQAKRLKPFAWGALILFLLFGAIASKWLTGVLMVIVGTHFVAALLSIALLSFVSGVVVTFCGNAKPSQSSSDSKNGD